MNKGRIAILLREKVPVGLFVIGVLLPPVVMLIMIQRFAVNVPFWDEWQYPPIFAKLYAGELSFADIWVQHNEHRIIFPRLITLMLGTLTSWNVLAQVYFSSALQLLSLFFVWRMLEITLRGSHAVLIRPLVIFVSFMFFSAVQGGNLIWGGASLEWFLTRFCAIVAIWAFARWPGRWIGVLTAFLASLVGMFTLAVGITLWGVGLLGILAHLFFQRKKVQLLHVLFWIVSATVLITAYFSNYHAHAGHPDPLLFTTHPVDFGTYVLAYLGSPFGFWRGYQLSAVLGFLGVMWLGVAVYWLARCSRKSVEQIIPWLLLGSYAIFNAITTGVGRLGFGVEFAVSPRYATVSTSFWVGLFVVLFVAQRQDFLQSHSLVRLWDMLATTSVVITLIVCYAGSYERGYREIRGLSDRLTLGLSYLYDYEVAPDEFLITFLPDSSLLRERARLMESLGLGPFSNKVTSRHLRLYAEPAILAEVAMGELVQDREVSQTFVSRCKELSRFDLFLATNGHVNAQPVIVRLTDVTTDQLIYEQTVPTSETSDNAWRQFLFEPLPDSALKTYRISLLSPDSQPGEGLIIWGSQSDAYPGGEAFINGNPINADLAFRYGCAPLSAGSTNWLDLSPGFRPEMIARKIFTINGQAKDVIFAHPPASIAWPVILPKYGSAILETYLGLAPEIWSEPTSDGVGYNVYIESADNMVTQVFARHVDPHHNEQDRRWIPVCIDLSQYAGQAITVRLETDFGPAGDPNYDWAGWASPVLTVSK